MVSAAKRYPPPCRSVDAQHVYVCGLPRLARAHTSPYRTTDGAAAAAAHESQKSSQGLCMRRKKEKR
ncbi:MAG: hypothetical protein MJA29_13640 [Candidatus Omnitrophica bacterium]|nr:hypothetical protein [Candidatus Omnitrophota bacterium]